MSHLRPFPLFVWLIYSVRKKLRRGFNQLNAAWADMTSILADTIPGIRVVKAFAQEQREIERFQEANDQILETSDRVNVVWAFLDRLSVCSVRQVFSLCGRPGRGWYLADP